MSLCAAKLHHTRFWECLLRGRQDGFGALILVVGGGWLKVRYALSFTAAAAAKRTLSYALPTPQPFSVAVAVYAVLNGHCRGAPLPSRTTTKQTRRERHARHTLTCTYQHHNYTNSAQTSPLGLVCSRCACAVSSSERVQCGAYFPCTDASQLAIERPFATNHCTIHSRCTILYCRHDFNITRSRCFSACSGWLLLLLLLHSVF